MAKDIVDVVKRKGNCYTFPRSKICKNGCEHTHTHTHIHAHTQRTGAYEHLGTRTYVSTLRTIVQRHRDSYLTTRGCSSAGQLSKRVQLVPCTLFDSEFLQRVPDPVGKTVTLPLVHRTEGRSLGRLKVLDSGSSSV